MYDIVVTDEEIIGMISHLKPEDLELLRDYRASEPFQVTISFELTMYIRTTFFNIYIFCTQKISEQNKINIGKKKLHHCLSRAGYEGEIKKLHEAAIAVVDKAAEDLNWMPPRSQLFI